MIQLLRSNGCNHEEENRIQKIRHHHHHIRCLLLFLFKIKLYIIDMKKKHGEKKTFKS